MNREFSRENGDSDVTRFRHDFNPFCGVRRDKSQRRRRATAVANLFSRKFRALCPETNDPGNDPPQNPETAR